MKVVVRSTNERSVAEQTTTSLRHWRINSQSIREITSLRIPWVPIMANLHCCLCTWIRPARLVATWLAAVCMVVFCSAGSAATPLVVAELDSQRQIAEADAELASAEYDLAMWQLTQLQALHRDGHASWQDVARQEVTTKSLVADVQASQQCLQAVLEWNDRLTKPHVGRSRPSSEYVQLYLPGSARLVASLPVEIASPELARRHLENLRAEHHSLSEIDLSSLETAIMKAKKAVELYGHSNEDASLLDQAKIRLRLADAAFASAMARKESASIIEMRMALIGKSLDKYQSNLGEPSPNFARAGTRFVDATSDRELARLAERIAIGESTASERITWLKHQHESALDRVDALQALAAFSHFDPNELEQAKQQKSDLELAIGRAQELLTVKQQIASNYVQKSELQSKKNAGQTESPVLEDACFTGASEVRHAFQLQQLKFQTAAELAGVQAQRDYLVERLRRVERIDEHARPPKELDHLRHKVQGVKQQLAIVDRDLALLDSEQQRFYHQVKSQQGQQYQLVQSDDGGFISRERFEVGAGLITLVSFAAQGELFPELPGMFPYIESTSVLDCLALLSMQAPGAMTEFNSLFGWQPGYDFGRPSLRSSWNAPCTFNGLRLATDGITYPRDLFCYVPSSLWGERSDPWWAPNYLPGPPASCGFRTFDPYQRYPFGSCGQSIFSYRVGSPTRASFPYRSSYLYRTAFPVRSNLYSYPYARPLGFVGSCFD